MNVEQEVVGKFHGEDVVKYKITNKQENYIEVMSQGATWLSFVADDANLLAHFDTIEEYYETPTYLCKSVGRVAGRIGRGKVEIGKKIFQLPQNEETNTLHGGPHGFSDFNWDATVIEELNKSKVVFSQNVLQTQDGFPGDLQAIIEYSFDEENQVSIKFSGVANGDGIFNPTNHAYFNLESNQASLRNHVLKINGASRLELNKEKLPTGEFLANKSTGYDFENGKLVTESLSQIKKEFGINELDDIFVVKEDENEPVAIISNRENGKQVAIYSDRPGVVVYTANIFGNKNEFNAIALEAQGLPDFMHHPEWGENYYLADTKKAQYEIRYHYNTIK